MDTFKKIIFRVRDVIEVYIPVLAFVGLFCVFVFQVFCRYVLRNPQSWATEVTASLFLWTVLLGACYAQRKKSHVQFTLIYDILPVRLKAFSAFLGNVIIAVAFAVCIKPTWDYILFMDIQKTSILKISMTLVYLPYMAFLVLILIYTLIELYEDFMIFTGLGGEKLIKKMEEEDKAEYQKAIEDVLDEGGLQ